MNITWIDSAKGGARTKKTTVAAISTHSSGIANKDRRSTAITIYPALMKRIRALVGDRVSVGFSDTHIAIKRVISGGHCMASTAGDKAKGSASTAIVKFTIETPFKIEKRIEFDMSELQIMDDGTVLFPVLDMLTR